MVDQKVEAINNTVENPIISGNDHEKWFEDNIPNYKSLAQIIAATLKITLEAHQISYVDIPFREKSKKSFLKKMEDKNKEKTYSPLDMTDLAGIRVITLIESDVHKVCELIKSLFNIHKKDSVNKSEILGDDKVGYRSVHFICDIGETRENLLEWKALKGLKFEIQVRTALEHAWAEIEHDRSYKLRGKLPSDLTRRFSLLSGLLESADLEFNRLSMEIEEYTNTLKNDIKNNKNLDIELTTVGVNTLINNKYLDYINRIDSKGEFNDLGIEELSKYGISNLDELDKKIIETLPYIKRCKFTSRLGFIRYVMFFDDLMKYFDTCWDNNINKWRVMDESLYECIKQRYPTLPIDEIFEQKGIKVIEF